MILAKKVPADKVVFRSSSSGKLMQGGNEITEKQISELAELEKRRDGKLLGKKGNVLGFSPTQKEKLKELEDKRDAPFELGGTAKSLVKEMWLQLNYQFYEEVYTKEMMKGHLCEQDSIGLVSRVHPEPVFRKKNSLKYNNGFVAGTPDICLTDELDRIEDVKTPWSIKTYFAVDSYPEIYKGQGQSYMWLTGARHFKLYYCLVNTPAVLLAQEEKSLFWKFGGNENNPYFLKLSEQLHRNHTYDHIPEDQRVKVFEFGYDPEYIEKLKDRIGHAREYYSTLTLNEIMESKEIKELDIARKLEIIAA